MTTPTRPQRSEPAPNRETVLTEPCSRPTCPGGTLHQLHLRVDAYCQRSREQAESNARTCATSGHVRPQLAPAAWERRSTRCERCGAVIV